MLNTPFSDWPSFTEEEATAVSQTLLSNRVNYWTGNETQKFEDEFAAWTGTRHAVALFNGTVALDLAAQALDIGPGDEVIVTPRTFIASASSIINTGARVVFADVDRNTQNITAETIAAVMTKKTRAIMCVHIAGWPCDMDPIMELADKHSLKVIEDCAQAHGASYKGRPVGGLGHVAGWSFCQDKIMTTGGEGGMLTTNDEAIWRRVWALKDHGKDWSTVFEAKHPPGFRWLHGSFGTNSRMTEMQSVIGRIQLKRMADWHARRKKNADAILSAANRLAALRVPLPPATIEHAWYKAYAFVRPQKLKPDWSRDRIVQEIERRGVPCYTGSCSEIYLEKAFDGTGMRPPERLPAARELGETSVMFLVHPTLTEHEIALTCNVLSEVVEAATA